MVDSSGGSMQSAARLARDEWLALGCQRGRLETFEALIREMERPLFYYVSKLILAAGRRCLLAAAEVGGVALLIDAKNESAARWYESYGAISLADAPRSLLLPLSTVQAALNSSSRHS
jgi:hypothetical protein